MIVYSGDREHRFWKNTKSAHDQIIISVHNEPEYTMIRNKRHLAVL